MEVYESVPRHARARHFRENERTEERSPEIDHGPLEVPENQGASWRKY